MRRSASSGARVSHLRFSSSDTARLTLVLCMVECSPIAVAVIVPNWPRVGERAPFGPGQAVPIAVDLREFAADGLGERD